MTASTDVTFVVLRVLDVADSGETVQAHADIGHESMVLATPRGKCSGGRAVH